MSIDAEECDGASVEVRLLKITPTIADLFRAAKPIDSLRYAICLREGDHLTDVLTLIGTLDAARALAYHFDKSKPAHVIGTVVVLSIPSVFGQVPS